LFTEVASRYEAVLRDYPKSTHHRRDLALMSARCGHNLDEALKLAQEAARLDDRLAANHDVLAEVHFHRSEQPAAIAAGTKALDLRGVVMLLQPRSEGPGFFKALLVGIGISIVTFAALMALAQLGLVGLVLVIIAAAVIAAGALWLAFDVEPAKAAIGGVIFL